MSDSDDPGGDRSGNVGPPLFDPYGRPLLRGNQEDGEAESADKPGPKDAPQASRARNIAKFILTWLSAPGALLALWGVSHQWALWVAACLACVALWLNWGVGKWSMGLSAGILLMTALAAPWLPPNEQPGHGRLAAGHFAAPETHCKTFKPGMRSIFLGGTSRASARAEAPHICVVRLAGHDLLRIDARGDSATVSAEVYDTTGLIARIIDNEFRVNMSQAFVIAGFGPS